MVKETDVTKYNRNVQQ